MVKHTLKRKSLQKKQNLKSQRQPIDIVVHGKNKKHNITAKASKLSPNTYYYDPEMGDYNGKIKIVVHDNNHKSKQSSFFKNGRYQVGGEDKDVQDILNEYKMKYTEPLFKNSHFDEKEQFTSINGEKREIEEMNQARQGNEQEPERKSTTSQIGEDLANAIKYTTGKHPSEHLETLRNVVSNALQTTASNISSIGQSGGRKNLRSLQRKRNKKNKYTKRLKNRNKHKKTKQIKRTLKRNLKSTNKKH